MKCPLCESNDRIEVDTINEKDIYGHTVVAVFKKE